MFIICPVTNHTASSWEEQKIMAGNTFYSPGPKWGTCSWGPGSSQAGSTPDVLHQAGDQSFVAEILHTKQDGGYRQWHAKICETLSDSAQIYFPKAPGLLGDNTSHRRVINAGELSTAQPCSANPLSTIDMVHITLKITLWECILAHCWLFSSQSCFSKVTFTYQNIFCVWFRNML